ncbi:MAG TPA: pyridoxal phosphate-dependent aminotransferase [Thermoanaerobaculaceae bacterium]|nr:pyridoxal phosphate-dependent aminotransferase [Thermoanaerobaculaceae bacterium]HPS76686.1 pyridoxal phosphate-dependent aminotransferase [Thermoanaerobaculaceae bacterium]
MTVFSTRTPADLRPNRISVARGAGMPVLDLTVSNPTHCGLPYPSDFLAPLGDPAGLAYRPDPRGLMGARKAVSGELVRLGAVVPPERILLTASTSEAYAFLFKLLCDPGEMVLAPVPSYPLFEHLARVEGVRALPYHLDGDHGWRLDLHELAAAPAGVKAVIAVHPNNPTGSHLHPEDAWAVQELCASRGWGFIVDEVFLDFPLAEIGRSLAGGQTCLTFSLGGLSKSVGLPQLKLGWIAASGPEGLVTEALERLEVIADTFLSVATPVQLALPVLLERGEIVRRAILDRCRQNLAVLRELAGGLPALEVLVPGGGWSGVLRYPAVVDEEDLVLSLLVDGVAVQPGFFFDFPRDGYLVLSLLPEPPIFREGVARLLSRLSACCG